jgi:DNA-directed RNA polymerase specialized sigma24 family protein
MPSHSRTRKLPKAQRQALILSAYPAIQRLARRYAINFAITTLEADDLAQIGCLEALEALARGIHPTGDKVRYLVGVARFAMLRYCGQHRSSITTPRKHGTGYHPTLVVLSLDAPLFADSEETLLDVLADGYNAAYDQYLDCLPY